MRPALAALALALAVCGAACLPRPRSMPPLVVYDFGLAAEDATAPAAVIAVPVVVRRPESPLWIDSPSIDYRLAYEDPAQIRSYAYATWVSSPVGLLGSLLRRRVAMASAEGVAAGTGGADDEGFVLQSTVEEFSQVFDSQDESRVVLRAVVALVRQSDRQVVARRAFALERPAPGPNAQGAVRGLGEAARQLADAVVVWLAETTARATATPPQEAGGR